MNPSGEAKWMIPDEVGALTKQFRVRVLNCGVAGCLLETNGPIAIGTVGKLRVSFSGKEFDDPIQVVRCGPMKDAADVHHVAAKFLSVTPPYAGTLRYMMWRDVGVLPGWLDTPGAQ
jgi:hypothetical protein